MHTIYIHVHLVILLWEVILKYILMKFEKIVKEVVGQYLFKALFMK